MAMDEPDLVAREISIERSSFVINLEQQMSGLVKECIVKDFDRQDVIDLYILIVPFRVLCYYYGQLQNKIRILL
jgi:hypothetical protein